MQEEEIEEFCETSSWETESGDDDHFDVDKPNKNKRNLSNSSALDDESELKTDGSDADSEKLSQSGWEFKEEANYKLEKRNYREYLDRQTLQAEVAQAGEKDITLGNGATELYEK